MRISDWSSDVCSSDLLFSISVPIPLFNSGRAAVGQASAERNRVEAQRRMTRLDVEQAILDARTEADNAATLARAANGPALAAPQEAARVARIGFREGQTGQKHGREGRGEREGEVGVVM